MENRKTYFASAKIGIFLFKCPDSGITPDNYSETISLFSICIDMLYLYDAVLTCLLPLLKENSPQLQLAEAAVNLHF